MVNPPLELNYLLLWMAVLRKLTDLKLPSTSTYLLRSAFNKVAQSAILRTRLWHIVFASEIPG
jgi:hypothetical protein